MNHGGDAATLTASTSPSRSCVAASAATSSPAARGRRGGLRADRDDRDARAERGVARAPPSAEARTTRSPSGKRSGRERARPVERRRSRPRALGRARRARPRRPRRAPPAGRGQLREQALLGRDAGDEVGLDAVLAQRLGRPAARSRRRCGSAALERAAKSSSTPFRLVTTKPVVAAARTSTARAERLDATSGQSDDLVARVAQRAARAGRDSASRPA